MDRDWETGQQPGDSGRHLLPENWRRDDFKGTIYRFTAERCETTGQVVISGRAVILPQASRKSVHAIAPVSLS
jgi:hypothetical protein